jgi:putative peptidoglycan lipid II flippase
MSDTNSDKSLGQRLGIAAVILAVSQLLSRILGFLRDAVIAYFHGASYATDAYHVAFQLPGYLAYLLAGGTLSITFIPLFSEYLNKGEEQKGWRLFSTITTVIGTLVVAGIVLLEIYTPDLIPLIAAPGFSEGKQLDLAVSMTRIVLPAQIGFVLGGLLQATLYVREVFWPSAVAPLIYNICIITGGVALNPMFGIKGFAIGALVGSILGPLFLPLWAARKHIEFTPNIDIYHPGFKRFLALSIPLMVGVSLVRVDRWLIQYFGSMQEHGAITWLKNARKVMMVLFAIIGQAIGQAALPFLTNLLQDGKSDKMGRLLSQNIQRAGFLALIATAGLVVIAEPAIYLIFEHGAFTPHDADMTAYLLIIFAAGLFGWISQSIAVRGFYAREDTLTPMGISTFMVVFVVPLYWWMNKEYGAAGLATATTVGITLTTIATIGVYRVKYPPLPLSKILNGLWRGLIFAAVCGATAWGIRCGLQERFVLTNNLDNTLLLLAMGVGFFGVGAVLALVWDPPETRYIYRQIREKLGTGGE